MNWDILDQIWERCLSKEMAVKEASDFISVVWALIKFHTMWKHLYPDYEEEHKRLIQLSIDVYKRAHHKE